MISPTSYSLYRRCPRAWWYQYVERLREPATTAQARGTEAHEAAESYLLTGFWPDTTPGGERARRAEALLSSLRVDGSVVETEIRAVLPGDADTLFGRVDYTHPCHTGYTHDGAPVPIVVDHKTTSDPRYWRTVEQLAVDPQLLAYAWALYPDAAHVAVGHLYLPPPPTDPALVVAYATHEALAANAADFAAVATEQAGVRAAPNADAVEARTSGCGAYGGCPHARSGRCSAAPFRFRPTPSEDPVTYTPAQLDLRRRMGLPVPADAAQPPNILATVEVAPVARILPPDSTRPKRKRRSAEELPGGRQSVGDAVVKADGVSEAAVKASDAGVSEAADAGVSEADAGVSDTHAPTQDICAVYVGCLPSRGICYTIEDALGDVLQLAARDGQTAYPSYLVVPYGRGPLLVACEVQTRVARQELVLPRRLYVPAGHPCAAALVPVLAAAGCEIVRCVA